MTDDDAGEWLTLAEAAARLGVRPVAIRRIQRKTIRVRPADREDDGRTRVWVPHSAGTGTGGSTGTMTGASTGTDNAEIAALRERIGRHESTEAELRARLADRDHERDRLIIERDRLAQELADERQHGRALAGRLDQLHERHWAELDVLRAELAVERGRPWW
jgi:hypothetical protein